MKKSTLVVAAVFVALLVVAVVLVGRPAERGITRFAIGDLPKDRIDRIVFTGKSPAELKRDGTTWRLASGKLADGAAVGRMLDSLAKMRSSDLLTRDEKRWAEYDVDDQNGTRLAVYEGGRELASVVIGKNVTGGLAVRTGEGAFRVSATAAGMFVRPAGGWIEHELFDDRAEDATRLEVKLAGAAPYALVKRDGAWAVEDPKALPAGFRFDADAARALVTSVAGLRAKDFEDADPGVDTTGLGDGADVLALTFAPAAPAGAAEAAAGAPAAAPVVRVLRLGKARGDAKDVYARVDGRDDVFTLYEGTARGLRKSVTELRDLRVMSFDPAKAQKLTIADGKVATTFVKKDGAWALASSTEPVPEGFELDPSAVERRVASLAAMRALRIAEPKEQSASGLGAPAARVAVTLEGGATATLLLGRETKDAGRDAVFARGNADAATYLVAQWTRQSLTGGLATLKKQPVPQGGMSGLDPSALSKLPPDVRESLLRQLAQKQREQQMLERLGGTPRPPAAPAQPKGTRAPAPGAPAAPPPAHR